MNLMELFVKIGVDDQASSKVKSISNTIGKGLSSAANLGTSAVAGTAKVIGTTLVTAAKAGAVALGTASAALIKLGKDAVDGYADYEQLVDGIETLFKNSADAVKEYADQAYKTAGVSANEYMETVTSFSASLLQSLEGDTKEATELANMAMVDMADNANKLGTDFSMIQTAYQAFAKNNWTLLDNLKLGYGGTAREMARLVNESGLLSEAQKINLDDTKNLGVALQEVGFDTIVKAIHAVQVEMGITGTTALEAAKTISGSAKAMKSSWKNLLVEIAKENGNVKNSFGEFTDSVSIFADNLMPRVEQVIEGFGGLVGELEPTISMALDRVMTSTFSMLPKVVELGSKLVSTLVGSIDTNKEKLSAAAVTIVNSLSSFVLNDAPKLFNTGVDLIVQLLKGFDIKDMSEKAGKVVSDMILYLTSPDNVNTFIDAGWDFLEGLVGGLTSGDNVERLVENFTNLVVKITNKISENKEKVVDGAISLLERLGTALAENSTIRAIVDGVSSVVVGIVSELISAENLKRVFETAAFLLDELAEGIFALSRNATVTIPDVVKAIVDAFNDSESTNKMIEAGKNLGGALMYGIHVTISDGIASFVNLLADDFATILGEGNAITKGLRSFADYNSNIRYNEEIAAMYGIDDLLRQQQQSVRDDLYTEQGYTAPKWEGVGTDGKLQLTQEMYDKLPDELKQGSNIVIVQNFNSETKSAADMQDEAMYAAQKAILTGH